MPKRLSAKRISGSSQALTAQELARRNDVSVEQMTGAIRMGSRDELKAQGGSVVGITKKVTGARLSARRQALSHLKSDPTYYKRLRREKEQQAKKGSQMNLVKNPSQTPPSPATEPKVIKNGDSSDSIAARHAAIIEAIHTTDRVDEINYKEHLRALARHYTRLGDGRNVDARKATNINTPHMRPGILSPKKSAQVSRVSRKLSWKSMSPEDKRIAHSMLGIKMAHAQARTRSANDSITTEIDSYLSERATDHPMQPKHWHTFAGGTGAKNPNHHSYTHHTEYGEYHINPPQAGPGRSRRWSLMFAHTRGGKNGGGKVHPNVPHSGLWHGLGNHKTAHAAMKAARDHHASAKLPTNDSVSAEIDAYLSEFVTSGAVGGFVGTTLGGTKLASPDLPDEVSKRLITLRKPSRPRPELSTTPWTMQGFDGKGA